MFFVLCEYMDDLDLDQAEGFQNLAKAVADYAVA